MRRSILALILCVVAACGSLSPRAQLVTTHQSIGTLLATVDDSERILCFGTVLLPPNPTRCTTSVAATVGLTDAVHKSISIALMNAFEAQVAVGKIIQTWTPGQAVDMSTLVAAVAELDTQLARLNVKSPNLSKLLSDVLRWKAEIEKLKKTFGGGL